MACSEVHVNVRYGGLHLLVHIDGLMTFVPLNYRCTLSLIIASLRIHASDAESLVDATLLQLEAAQASG